MRVYKYQLKPTKSQEKVLEQNFTNCRFVYNQLLEKLQNSSEINRSEIQHHIVTLKQENPILKNSHSKTLQYECYRLFSNLQSLKRLRKNGRKTGKLRFKGARWFKTIVYNQTGYKILERPEKRYDILKLSKIGSIKLRMHRGYEGNVKGIAIKKKADSWEAHVITDAKYELEGGDGKIGIDLGVKSLVTTSNNDYYDNPLYTKASLERLKRIQKRISKSKLRSNNRERLKKDLEKAWEKIDNQKNDYLHKLTTKLVSENSFIAVEDLDIQEMVSNEGEGRYYNHRNILDSNWGRFLQMLELKAESAGVRVVRVNPKCTSMKCSSCGSIRKMPLAVRLYSCKKCGLHIDRDHNAALNILGEGLAVAGEELLGSSMIQEAPSVRAV